MTTNTTERREQITVPLGADLRRQVERVAAAEHRTVAGQIRHFIAYGLAAQEHVT
jgi:hypothetical protein